MTTPPIHLHNTLTRQKELFQPRDPNHVTMYVCGPTVYDFAHLGNARPVVVFDMLYRLLQRNYERVTYVRNITDIDDKIMLRAKENGETIANLTERTTAAYHEDMAALNALPPTLEPRATGHIAEMQALISLLIAKGHAYIAEGHVLFHVPIMAAYGGLSRRPRDELIAGARVDVAPYKQDPADFVLWKPSTTEQEGWDAPADWQTPDGLPLGRGRPGWHIECSAMAKKCLGNSFDIHGGGLDLIFPHHENEIAQSACAHDGAPLANYWLHNGFLTIEGEKMSKSLGNFFTVRDVRQRYHGEVIRLVLLSAHYRQPLDFTEAALQQAKKNLDKWYGAAKIVPEDTENDLDSGVTLSETELNSSEAQEFMAALSDDLNTPQAITLLHKLANQILQLEKQHAADVNELHRLKRLLRGLAKHYLGLLTHTPEAWESLQPAAAQDANHNQLDEATIEAAIVARLAARKAKNFAESDRIRDELAASGIVLEDTPSGTTWRR